MNPESGALAWPAQRPAVRAGRVYHLCSIRHRCVPSPVTGPRCHGAIAASARSNTVEAWAAGRFEPVHVQGVSHKGLGTFSSGLLSTCLASTEDRRRVCIWAMRVDARLCAAL